VEIHGLEGAQHLNGKKGKLKTFHTSGDHARRWAVRVNGKDVAIKPENLKKFVEVVVPNERRQVDEMIQALQSGKMDIDKLAPLPDKQNWAKGLSTTDQYEWFSNCYQMRCDDDYVYGGCNLHGPYNPDCTPLSLRDDFMIFCYLAVENRCIPGCWDWNAFLKAATQYVVFAFEKSDARERWGGENVFAAMSGGRSLRYTAEAIYGTGVQDDSDSPQAEAAMVTVRNRPSDAVFDQIGGRDAWKTFLQDLRAQPRFQ